MADLFAFAEESESRRRQMLRTAFGPAIAAALTDPAVIEVMVNPDGRLWLDKTGTGRIDTGERVAVAEAERIIDHGIRIATQCSNTGTRPPAERLRRKILTLLPDLDGPLVLDFTGVRSASSSFLDELLGRLAKHLGREEFHRRVRVIGMEPLVKQMADVVVGQRMNR